MRRLRALLAVFLAVTWCSAAWHVDLEAAGLFFDHEHHAHGDHGAEHGPAGSEHEEIVARDVAKDQVRVGGNGAAWFALPGHAGWWCATPRPTLAERTPERMRRGADPDQAGVWHFLRRCAPAALAPPALG